MKGLRKKAKPLICLKVFMRLISLMLIISLPGCKKDFDFSKAKDLSWNPDLALPLVNDSITLKKALVQTGTEDHFYIDESGDISILFYFNNNAFRLRPNDLIKLSPVSFPYRHTVTQDENDILRNSDLTIPPVTFILNPAWNNPGIRIDKLLVRKGTIHVNSNSTFNNDGYLTVRILNAIKNGAPFSFTIDHFVT